MRLLGILAVCVVALSSGAQVSTTPPPILPDKTLTPGISLPVTKEQVCVKGYAKSVRNVPQHEKNLVYKEYGILKHKPGQYEIDHLISLELGGSNDIKNLWPESYVTPGWNAHTKDSLENKLHSDMCSGQITLKDAQVCISCNWIDCYKKTFNKQVP